MCIPPGLGHRAGRGHHGCAHPRADRGTRGPSVPQARFIGDCPASSPGGCFESQASLLTWGSLMHSAHFTFISCFPVIGLRASRLMPESHTCAAAGHRKSHEVCRTPRVREGPACGGRRHVVRPTSSALPAKCPQADTHPRRSAGGRADYPGHLSSRRRDPTRVNEPTQV